MLNLANFNVLEASNGLQGLQILKEHKPVIVTCDISMPVMDGFQFLEAVKQDPEISDVPVIVVTAMGRAEETAKAKKLGADACLTKPFSSSHLLEVINTLLKK